MSDRLLSTGEAAKALGVDPSTLARWAREGRVTSAKRTAGGHWRWSLPELEQQVEALWKQDRES